MKINLVEDNRDKQRTYKYYKQRCRKAMANEYYLEAMIIVYALIEDRLRSLLYHIGAIHNFEDRKLNVNKSKRALRRLYFGSDEKAHNKRLDINKFSVKIELIRCTLCLSNKTTESIGDTYLLSLIEMYKRMDVERFLIVLSDAEDWAAYRNEVVHSLFNKNVYSVNENLKKQVEKGKNIADYLDLQVGKLSGKRNVRSINGIKDNKPK
jgi:hypothetical protein